MFSVFIPLSTVFRTVAAFVLPRKVSACRYVYVQECPPLVWVTVLVFFAAVWRQCTAVCHQIIILLTFGLGKCG